MARIDIDIEDYLDEVGTSALISELEDRKLDKYDVEALRTLLSTSSVLDKLQSIKPLSLIDTLKLEEFLDTLNK